MPFKLCTLIRTVVILIPKLFSGSRIIIVHQSAVLSDEPFKALFRRWKLPARYKICTSVKTFSLRIQPNGERTTPSKAKAKTPAPDATENVLKIKIHGHKFIHDIFCTITGCSVIDVRSRCLIQVIPSTVASRLCRNKLSDGSRMVRILFSLIPRWQHRLTPQFNFLRFQQIGSEVRTLPSPMN